ncbi:MAG: type VII toxin-antitoxin system HepT family RNase toxin [Candidatus Helarchaeota archaeon]
MDELRLKRYKDKINYIVDKLKDIPRQPKTEFEKDGIFYAVQTSIEAMMDIIAMLVKDLGTPVKDDANNIAVIIQKRKLKPKLGEDLNKANGLRNILVHRYNKVDEDIVLNSIKKIKKLLFKWLDIVEGILHELSQL